MRIYTTLLQMGLLLLLIGCSGIEGKYKPYKEISFMRGDTVKVDSARNYIKLTDDGEFELFMYFPSDRPSLTWRGSYTRHGDTLRMEIYDKEKHPDLIEGIFPDGKAYAKYKGNTLQLSWVIFKKE